MSGAQAMDCDKCIRNKQMFARGWSTSVNGCLKPSLVEITVADDKTPRS
jgi:hypothetical protein